MTERILPYDRGVVPQETLYWCGPASAQVVLNSRGIHLDERDLALQIGTHTGGTDYIGLISPILNRHLGGGYIDRYIENDPATPQQAQQLWDDIVVSIDAGYGVIANIVAPPSNYPRGVKGSISPAYSGGTVYHYIAIMGYSDDGERAVWVADSGFRPYGYWCAFEQMATLIPPKGYTAVPGERRSEATMFGIDVSNHQGAFDFAAAAAEGFTFATHKISEGTWCDPMWPRARAEMQQHFPHRWGGYVYCRVGTDPNAEADTAIRHAGGPCMLQIDYEDMDRNGSLDDLTARIAAFLARGFTLLPIYLPRWYWHSRMGSPDLSGLPVGIWNSHYVQGTGYASDLYPGDDHPGWDPMGGKPVEILQFSESAAVAGRHIDVNAIRGGESALTEIFGGDMTDEQDAILRDIQTQLRGPNLSGWPQLGQNADGQHLTLVDAIADLRNRVAKLEGGTE